MEDEIQRNIDGMGAERMTDTTKPESCPWCVACTDRNSQSNVHLYWDKYDNAWIECHGCGSRGPGNTNDVDAIEDWNLIAGMARRAAEAAYHECWIRLGDSARLGLEMSKSAIVSSALIRARENTSSGVKPQKDTK